MAIKLIGIGGEPATGKSTLMSTLFPEISQLDNHTIRLLRYHQLEYGSKQVYILGDYTDNGTAFTGTDRLSMAVMPEVVSTLRIWSMENLFDGSVVMFEGDRLFSKKLFNAVRDMQMEVSPEQRFDVRLIVLRAAAENLSSRHDSRGDTQSESWLKGRATKVNRLCTEFSDWIEERNNDNMAQTLETIKVIQQIIQG